RPCKKTWSSITSRSGPTSSWSRRPDRAMVPAVRRLSLSRRLELGALLVVLPCSIGGCPTPASEGDSSSDESGDVDTQTGDGDDGDDSPQVICVPEDTRCADATTLEVCASTGLKWDAMFC